MARPNQPNTPQSRDRGDAWLRRATRAAVLGATGAAALIGVVVAQERPGSSSTGSGSTGTSSGGTSSTSESSGSSSTNSSGHSGSDSNSSDTGSTGNTGNTGDSGTSTPPSISHSSPSVTSGGSSGR